ncbi:MAG: hypothetical protein ACRCYU_23255 [Nocardioides sp.]
MAITNGRRGRAVSDEFYVIDLCDEVLGKTALRQHRFAGLVGDPSPKTGRTAGLPVDAYWPTRDLVVEFYERQHSDAVPFFDKPDRLTVSGVSRGEQRALYDERRRQLVPQQGIRLVVITLDDLGNKARSSGIMTGTWRWSPSCLASVGATPARRWCAACGAARPPCAGSMGAGR